MREAYLGWAGLLTSSFEEGLRVGREAGLPKPETVIVCGMGGSGIVGDYAAVLSSVEGGVPVHVVKSYSLPAWAPCPPTAISKPCASTTRIAANHVSIGRSPRIQRGGRTMLMKSLAPDALSVCPSATV
jgi:Ni,Fe-hydrogenase III small subunit